MNEIITDEEIKKKFPLTSWYLKGFDGEETNKLAEMPINKIKSILEESDFMKGEDINGIKHYFEIGSKYHVSDEFISFIGYTLSSENKNNKLAFCINIIKNTGEIIRSDSPLTKTELKLFN